METRPAKLRDDEIIARLKEQKAMDEAIRSLYREHFHVLSDYVVRNSGTADDAQDIFQEVIIAFVSLVQAGKFRGESSIRTFLYALNRNIWLNELKKRGRSKVREMKYELGNDSTDPNIDFVMENREGNALLMSVVEELGETCKQILLLYYFENQSMKEILSNLHYENEQVVRNKKYKCLKKLEELVSSQPKLYQQLKNLLHD